MKKGKILTPKELIAAKNAKNISLSSSQEIERVDMPQMIEEKIEILQSVVKTPQKDENEDKVTYTPSPTKNSLSSQLPSLECVRQGKEGWLYRENECYRHDDEDYQQKIWVVVEQGKFVYFQQRPNKDHLGDPLGYIDLNFQSDCRIVEKRVDKCVARYPFRVKELSTSIILFAISEQERTEWMDIVLEATRGVHHFSPISSVPRTGVHSPDRKLNRQLTRSSSAIQMGYQTVEYPKMIGILKKKSIEGKTLGFKNTKHRWFRLECGELRYYKTEQMLPDSLKGVFQLRGCMMPQGEANEGDRISITRSDGFSLMMTANTVEIAREWRVAIKGTLDILDSIYRDSRSTSGKIRRCNLSTIYDDGPLKYKNIEKSAVTIEILKSGLRSHFLLEALEDFTPLLCSLDQHIYLSGDVIQWQESVGNTLYVIESGQVEVIRDDKLVEKLGTGRMINELAIINDVTASSTIRANMTVILWSLERKFVRDILKRNENLFRNSQVDYLKSVTMFEKLNDNTLRQIADVLKVSTYEANERIIKQGEVGDKFYLIVSGKVSVTQSSLGSSSRELVQLGRGKYFGELALISNEPRKANVIALEDVVCYTIDKQTFNSVLGTLKDAETESTGIAILKKVKILQGLTEKQLLTIAKCLESVSYSDGCEIISQGEEGDKFYMIVSGEVIVYVNHVEVARLKSGSYFGEMALMNDERRNATIAAAGEVTCLTLNRTEFVRFLGPLDEILKEEARRREEEANNQGLLGTARRFTRSLSQSFSRRSSVKKVTGIGAASNVEYDLDEFEYIRILGYGRFGFVKLARRQGFNGVYAIKILYKQPLVDLNLQMIPYQERDFLQFFDHPFIPSIYATFQDQNCFYLLLEAIPGGDFWSILYDRQCWTKLEGKTALGGLQIEIVKFYFSNILCAIDYLHNHEVIYRDLKPENMVMDRTGYLKLVDFGSAKKLPVPNVTNTLCGTPEYLAPEMITAIGHNRAVDYWSLGIFLYELIYGKTPFEHNDMKTMYQSILASGETLPSQVKSMSCDSRAKDLILNLLKYMPGLRLGMLRNGIADIWNHSLLTDVSASLILNKSISPPIRPDIEHLLDLTPLDELDIEMDSIYSGRFNFPDF